MSGLLGVQPTEARIEVSWPRPDVAVVVLEGEHDLESAPRLELAMGDALLTCSELLVDLSLAQFIDSSTINVLVRMKREADRSGSNFSLVLDGSPNVEHTLEICRVLGRLNRVASVDAAVTQSGSSGELTPARSPASSSRLGFSFGRYLRRFARVVFLVVVRALGGFASLATAPWSSSGSIEIVSSSTSTSTARSPARATRVALCGAPAPLGATSSRAVPATLPLSFSSTFIIGMLVLL
jgi:anti-anti-sigma factor